MTLWKLCLAFWLKGLAPVVSSKVIPKIESDHTSIHVIIFLQCHNFTAHAPFPLTLHRPHQFRVLAASSASIIGSGMGGVWSIMHAATVPGSAEATSHTKRRHGLHNPLADAFNQVTKLDTQTSILFRIMSIILKPSRSNP